MKAMAPEKVAQIIDLYNKGYSHKGIATAVGCATPTVDRILSKNKVPRVPRRCRRARRFGINVLDYYDEDIIGGH